MKSNVLSIFFICVVLVFYGCAKDEALNNNSRVDLTRNTINAPRWMLALPNIDSISYDGIPFYEPFPESTRQSFRILFGLKSLNVENSVYLRTTEFEDKNTSDLFYIYDTIMVQTNNNDSIICKIPSGFIDNDTIRYIPFTFHGKYNKLSGNVEGFVYPFSTSYRCPYCPGKVYRYYTGNYPAMFIPYGP